MTNVFTLFNDKKSTSYIIQFKKLVEFLEKMDSKKTYKLKIEKIENAKIILISTCCKGKKI